MLDAALFGSEPLAPTQSERLIRLFIQSPCIPFLDNKDVTIEERPDFVMKVEPDTIRMGYRYAEGPVGMILLRYAIEWYIWRDRVPSAVGFSVCDLAAARVTALFLSFLESQAQTVIRSELPGSFIDALSWAGRKALTAENYRTSHLAYLASLRSKDADGNRLTATHLEILAALAAPTEYHFTQGGDTRLLVDSATRLNVYGCQPFPRNDAFTFSSSTATSVSSYAYAESEKYRQQIIADCLKLGSLQPLEQYSANIRKEITRVFGVADTGCEVMISSSGTDSQLHAVTLASTVLEDGPLLSLVVASDETGSGTPLSVTGRHFSDITDLAVPVCKGEPITGMPDIDYRAEPLRDESGRLRTPEEMDRAVWRAIDEAVQRGCTVLLHVMDQSKLGCWSPSLPLLDDIQREFGASVQIIVDACQARIDSIDIRHYLLKDYIVLITGSKFYTGPPFSGAALIPEGLAKRAAIAGKSLPVGLADYVPGADLAEWLPAVSSSRPHNGIAMYLRWWAALAEVKRYNDVPEGLRQLGLDFFCHTAERILREADFVELVFDSDDGQYAKTEIAGTELSCRRTILPFQIVSQEGYLDTEETKRVYEMLNRDISELINGTADELRLAARSCHIGQPVRIFCGLNKASAVLRISAGARILSESWLHKDAGMFFKKIGDEADQIEFIVRKIGLILRTGLHRITK